LKPDCRPIDDQVELVSPCDGKVLHCGPIDMKDDGQVEQVKGMTYSLSDFIGECPARKLNPGNQMYHVTLYLAPGDYHCFHSPTDWFINTRRHFSGKLLSVRPSVATWMPKLFAQNERVAYIGNWNNGQKFFAFVAVGATNVGSIIIDMDPELNTNCIMNSYGTCQSKMWNTTATVKQGKGQHFGEFNLGSTVVLIFEAGQDFQFHVKPGDKVKMGLKL